MTKDTFENVICAPATIPGTGAIAIIRVSGKGALKIADKVVTVKGDKIAETEGYRLKYGTISNYDGSLLDEVVVSVFRSPHSYTGEDSVEISCHSSKYIVNTILKLLLKAGADMAAPGEFTQRAFLNGKMDLAQAEAVADLIASSNEASHNVAIKQLKGGFSKELRTLRDELLKMTSLLELELDFSEEDVEFAGRAQLISLVNNTLNHINHLADSFSRGNAIKNGIPVVIAGSTNAGKSTLLNALVGEDRAIVSDMAGTTRDTIEETMTIDGVQFRFIDTAGIRDTQEYVERIGIERTFAKINEASIVLGMVDASLGLDSAITDINLILSSTIGDSDKSGDINAGSITSRVTGSTARITSDSADNSEDRNENFTRDSRKKTLILLNKFDLVEDHKPGQNLEEDPTYSRKNDSLIAPEDDTTFPQKIHSTSASGDDSTTLREIDSQLSHEGGSTFIQQIDSIFSTGDDSKSGRNKIDAMCSTGDDSELSRKKIDAMCSTGDDSESGRAKASIVDIIPISAKYGTGLQQLKNVLSRIAGEIVGNTDETLVTNVRHYNALVNASDCLTRVHTGLEDAYIPVDLIAQDLREALYHLGSIIGEISTDEVLGNIFKNFCVGK